MRFAGQHLTGRNTLLENDIDQFSLCLLILIYISLRCANTLLASVGMGSIPTIKIEDADHGGRRTLYLKHEHDGRDLQLEYAERTLEHVRKLWGREVVLETVVNGRRSLLRMQGDALKIERI